MSSWNLIIESSSGRGSSSPISKLLPMALSTKTRTEKTSQSQSSPELEGGGGRSAESSPAGGSGGVAGGSASKVMGGGDSRGLDILAVRESVLAEARAEAAKILREAAEEGVRIKLNMIWWP